MREGWVALHHDPYVETRLKTQLHKTKCTCFDNIMRQIHSFEFIFIHFGFFFLFFSLARTLANFLGENDQRYHQIHGNLSHVFAGVHDRTSQPVCLLPARQ